MSARALIAVSWCVPPVLLPRSVQVARSLKGLKRRGWQTTIVTPRLETLPDPPVLDARLETAYRDQYEVVTVDLTRVDHTRAGWATRTWDRWFGDYGLRDEVVWIQRAADRALSEARRRKAAALITFAQPWRDHLVGIDVTARKPRLPWVAHFSDPWTDSLYADLRGPAKDLELRREAAVVGRADRIVFTNSYAADLVMRKYPPRWREKARVIPHAMDHEILPVKAARDGVRRPIEIVHAGNLFIGRRTGSAIFEALATLKRDDPRLGDRLRVVFLGEGSGETEARTQVFLRRLEDVVEFRPRVPYLESLEAMRDADVLLLIDAPSETNVFLPSKLIDYLIAERPLLALTPEVGATADVIRRYGGEIVNPTDAAAVASTLTALLRRFESGQPVSGPPLTAAAREFGIDATAHAFAAVIEEVTSR